MSQLSSPFELVQSFLMSDDSYSENITSSSNDWSSDNENQICFINEVLPDISSMNKSNDTSGDLTPQLSRSLDSNFLNEVNDLQDFSNLICTPQSNFSNNKHDAANTTSEYPKEVAPHTNVEAQKCSVSEYSTMECSTGLFCVVDSSTISEFQNLASLMIYPSCSVNLNLMLHDINLCICNSEDAVYLYQLLNLTYKNTFVLNLKINMIARLEYLGIFRLKYKRKVNHRLFSSSKRRKITRDQFLNVISSNDNYTWDESQPKIMVNNETEDVDDCKCNKSIDDEYQFVEKELYSCLHCGKSYSTEKSLSKHIGFNVFLNSCNTDSNKVLDICNFCHMSFTAKCALRKHLSEEHQSKIDDLDNTARISTENSNSTDSEDDSTFDVLPVVKLMKSNFDLYFQLKKAVEERRLSKEKITDSSKLSDITDIKRIKCSVCGRWYENNDAYTEHYRVHTKQRRHKCHSCDRTFDKLLKLKMHSRSVHHKGIGTLVRKSKTNVRHKTAVVKLSTSTAKKTKKTAKSDPPIPVAPSASICSDKKTRKKTYTYVELVELMRDAKKPFICEFCRKVSSSKRDYIDHYLIHTGEKPFMCDICGHCFNKERAMRKHRLSHAAKSVLKVQPYRPPTSTTVPIKTTITSSTKNKKVEDTSKDNKFNLRRSRRECKLPNDTSPFNNQITSVQSAIFKCRACSVKFRLKSSLVNHEKFCLIKKGYFLKQSLTQKSTVTKNVNQVTATPNLQRCMKLFNGKVRYTCDRCGRLFHRRYVFIEHYRSHTGERPFSCTVCKTVFTRRSSYMRHCRKNHSSGDQINASVVNQGQYSNSEDESTNGSQSNGTDDEFIPLDALEVEVIEEEEEKGKSPMNPGNETTETPLLVNIKHEIPDLIFDDLFECKYNIDYETNVSFEEKPQLSTPNQENNSCSIMSIKESSTPPADQYYRSHNSQSPSRIIKHEQFIEPECVVVDNAVDGDNIMMFEDEANEESEGCNENQLNYERNVQSKFSFKCGYCDQMFLKFSLLHEHLAIHTKSHVCRHCDEYFSDSVSFMSHMRTFHIGKAWYTCDKCEKSFRTKRTFEEHYTSHSEVKPYKCGRCDTPYSSRTSLMRHIKKNCGITCEQCGQVFTDNIKLQAHLLDHITGKVYKCSNCNESFYSSAHLWEHYRMCMVDGTLQDPLAVQSVTSTEASSPVYNNSGDDSGGGDNISDSGIKKRHSCTQCDKSFVKRFQLTQHYIVHSGVRPFQCEYCNSTFFRNDSLKRHRKKCWMEQQMENIRNMHFLA